MTDLTRHDRRILGELLIDLEDYAGQLLLTSDRGGTLMPPSPLPGGPNYEHLSHAAMQKLERNRRVAKEIYRTISDKLRLDRAEAERESLDDIRKLCERTLEYARWIFEKT